MKTNIIIGRFQTDKLTAGHKHLIESSLKMRKGAHLVFFLGDTELNYTSRNPLPAILRAKMLKKQYPNSIVKIMYDCRTDEEWSERIDQEALRYKNPVLFGSRDSFFTHYKGRLKYKEVPPLLYISATARRNEIRDAKYSNPMFRAGIIHTVENKFPTAYPTVDIAVLREMHTFAGDCHNYKNRTPKDTRLQLLLGRKPGRDKYCFVGGFVDPLDESLEQAAGRELGEEVQGILAHEFKYIGSRKVNDFRYKGTKDGIMTSLFVAYKLGGTEIAGDDIEEVKWFDLSTFDLNILTEHHHPLFEMLKKHLKL